MKIHKNILNDPFLMEVVRDQLATKGRDKSFVSTYSENFKSIADLNTKEFWNNKLKKKGKIETSPIALHRESYIYHKLIEEKGQYLGIGFGNSRLEKKLSSSSKLALSGIDISTFAVNKANKTISGNFLVGNILKIPFKKNAFNLIVVSEVLEHLPPTKILLAYPQLNRVLRKKGKLIVSVPINEELESMVLKHKNLNGHMREYTANILKKELELNGFEILSVKYLFAFANLYYIKTLVQKYILKNRWKPNNLIIIAQKK